MYVRVSKKWSNQTLNMTKITCLPQKWLHSVPSEFLPVSLGKPDDLEDLLCSSMSQPVIGSNKQKQLGRYIDSVW